MAKKLTEDQFDHSMKSLAETLGLEYNPISGTWRRPFAAEIAANRAGHQREASSEELMNQLRAAIDKVQRSVNDTVGKRDEDIDSLRRNMHQMRKDFKMLTDFLGVLFVDVPETRTIQKVQQS